MQQILTHGQGTNLFSFPNSQFPPESPTSPPVTSSSLSHTVTPSLTPKSRLRPIIASLSHIPERSWRDEGKNWEPKLCFFLSNGGELVIRDKKMIWVCRESMFIFWVFYN
ncbi:hypothetical protein NC651_025516 [Populus alba x Populus x berolinensis]|nr:hypothetical protein NC651_025516 [Populus alba x Populus x berolinensis]